MNGLVLLILAAIAFAIVWVETNVLEGNIAFKVDKELGRFSILKKEKPKKVSLFEITYTELCKCIDDKIRQTYFPRYEENNVEIPINYKLRNKITMLSDKEEHKLLDYLKKEYIGSTIRVNREKNYGGEHLGPVYVSHVEYPAIYDVEFKNNFKGPYTTVIFKFK